MGRGLPRLALAALALYPCRAVAAMPSPAAATLITPREAFLAAAIAAMVGCGLFSIALSGRAAPRTHVAVAMLVVLIGGFSLLVLFGAVIGLVLVLYLFAIHPLLGLAGLAGLALGIAAFARWERGRFRSGPPM